MHSCEECAFQKRTSTTFVASITVYARTLKVPTPRTQNQTDPLSRPFVILDENSVQLFGSTLGCWNFFYPFYAFTSLDSVLWGEPEPVNPNSSQLKMLKKSPDLENCSLDFSCFACSPKSRFLADVLLGIFKMFFQTIFLLPKMKFFHLFL